MLIKVQREVKFFSREATHVITTRPIPAELDTSSSNPSSKGPVNPTQLETKKSVFDIALQKPSGPVDILSKAREMGMKIWPAEKLQRMLTTMYNTDTGEEPPNYSTRHATAAAQPKLGRQADLQKLLQNEKLNGPLDRDHSVAAQDTIQLRGFYIYIHDMDEVTRPVMVREYPKVAKKDEGKWPQFRLSGNGKCPFIEDQNHMRKQEQEELRAKKAAVAAAAPRTRAAAAMEEKRVLVENNNTARRPSITRQTVQDEDTKPLDPPKMIPTKRPNTTDSMPPMFGSAQASIRSMPRFAGGQPIASGIQQSNITSAIRSQMISSTSAAPGARAGNSKEVNQLKRKVLEKTNVPSANSGHSSVMNDMRAALNQECAQPGRAAKRKAQENMGYIREDTYPEEEERHARKIAVTRRRKTAEKELKPGYCENCREKFNDFEEVRPFSLPAYIHITNLLQHCLSRKHRKFAITTDNWVELDTLLARLVRQ
jgi:regulatory subunit for Cdc7p protein kinase